MHQYDKPQNRIYIFFILAVGTYFLNIGGLYFIIMNFIFVQHTFSNIIFLS